MKKQKVCIVGGGLAGLVTAATLSKLDLDSFRELGINELFTMQRQKKTECNFLFTIRLKSQITRLMLKSLTKKT